MEQISQIHYAEHFPFSFHSSVNGVSFDKIYRNLIGKNTLDRFFIRIFALFGYKYLVCAIVISMQDSYLLNGVTTKLCPEIARRYGVSPDSIERSIRTVISAIWYDRDPALLRDFMGRSYQFQPGNAKFIGIASRRFSLYLRAAMRSRKEKPEKVRLYRAFWRPRRDSNARPFA